MARPFQQNDDPEDKKDKGNNIEDNIPSQKSNSTSRGGSMKITECDKSDENSSSKGTAPCTPNIYCTSNSSPVNCGTSFTSVTDEMDHSGIAKIRKDGTDRKIKIRKGVLTSSRCITPEDVQIVAGDIKDDWKVLLKKLPVVTRNDLQFHQTVINAMDRGDGNNMAEVVLTIWRSQFPELSTVGNLAKILFNMDHPDVVSNLKP